MENLKEFEEYLKQHRFFFDLDGTTAEWKSIIPESEEDMLTAIDRILYAEKYYLNLNPYKNIVNFIKYLSSIGAEVYISSCYLPDRRKATPLKDKNTWCDIYLPCIDNNHRIFIPDGESKTKHINNFLSLQNKPALNKQDIAFDDYLNNISAFKREGCLAVKVLNGINNAYTGDCFRINKDSLYHSIVADMVEIITLNERRDKLSEFQKAYLELLRKVTLDDCFVGYSLEDLPALNYYLLNNVFPKLISLGGEGIYENGSLVGVSYNKDKYYTLDDKHFLQAINENTLNINAYFHYSPCDGNNAIFEAKRENIQYIGMCEEIFSSSMNNLFIPLNELPNTSDFEIDELDLDE